jgi:cation transport regulator ChaB
MKMATKLKNAAQSQHAGRDDRRDGVGGVVEAVHEVEHQCQRHQQHKRPERELQVHGQTFSTTTASMMFATSWHLSMAFSRYS